MSNQLGYSGSIDQTTGEWFATRCGYGAWNESDPILLIGECHRSEVVAHFTRRDEAEIEINPDEVKITKSIAISRVEGSEVGND